MATAADIDSTRIWTDPQKLEWQASDADPLNRNRCMADSVNPSQASWWASNILFDSNWYAIGGYEKNSSRSAFQRGHEIENDSYSHCTDQILARKTWW